MSSKIFLLYLCPKIILSPCFYSSSHRGRGGDADTGMGRPGSTSWGTEVSAPEGCFSEQLRKNLWALERICGPLGFQPDDAFPCHLSTGRVSHVRRVLPTLRIRHGKVLVVGLRNKPTNCGHRGIQYSSVVSGLVAPKTPAGGLLGRIS